MARLIEAGKEAGPAMWSCRRSGSAPQRGTASFLPTKEFPALPSAIAPHAGKDHVSQSYQDALNRRLRLLKPDLRLFH